MVVDAEKPLEIDRMVDDVLALTEYRDYACPAYKTPKRMPDEIRAVGA